MEYITIAVTDVGGTSTSKVNAASLEEAANRRAQFLSVRYKWLIVTDGRETYRYGLAPAEGMRLTGSGYQMLKDKKD